MNRFFVTPKAPGRSRWPIHLPRFFARIRKSLAATFLPQGRTPLPRSNFATYYPLLVLCALGGLNSASASEETRARLFASSALAFRAAAASGERSAMAVFSELPGAAKASRDLLPALWGPFFENAVVKLGRLNAAVPAALYYNPLLDVALFTFWRRQGDAYAIYRAHALPGERLQEPRAAVSLFPAWIGANASPIETLSSVATGRLAAFRRQHPPDANEAGRATTTFADAAANTRDVLARLAWNTAQRLQWTEAGLPWLAEVLAEVEKALDARDAGRLSAAAFETDTETAAALARLPSGFIERLSLDMVLGAGGSDYLLIGSIPEEGGIYVLAACRLEGDRCALRRLALLSVIGL